MTSRPKRRLAAILTTVLVALSAIVIVPTPSVAESKLPRHAMGAYVGWLPNRAESFGQTSVGQSRHSRSCSIVIPGRNVVVGPGLGRYVA